MSIRGRVVDVAVLIRVHNCLLAAASVLVGAFLAAGRVPAQSLAASAAAFLVCAGGYALNDVYDIMPDRVNRPRRPLASGSTARGTALALVIACWAAGLGVALRAGRYPAAFALCWAGLVWLYSAGLKSAGAAGHILVSALSASGFLLGSILGGSAWAGLLPFSVAFAFHLAREVTKGAADREGDLRAGLRTLPARISEKATANLCAALIAAAMVLSLLPYASGRYGALYLIPVVGMQPLLAMCIYTVTPSRGGRTPAGEDYARAASMLKAVMPLGLLAFLIGGI